MEKTCRRCEKSLDIEMFRTRPNGFTLNQCKSCESELGKIRRLGKEKPSTTINITTRSGKVVDASTVVIPNGRVATSPDTDKVLYFDSNVNRDLARIAFSAYANISRTGIKYQTV